MSYNRNGPNRHGSSRFPSGGYSGRNDQGHRGDARPYARQTVDGARDVSSHRSGVDKSRANTNDISANSKEPSTVPAQGALSAEDKRKARQAKLAKWKQKQEGSEGASTPEPVADKENGNITTSTVVEVAPVVLEKKRFAAAKMKKPVLGQRKGAFTSKSIKKPLFDDGDDDARQRSMPPLKKSRLENGSVPNAGPEPQKADDLDDSLEKFMVSMEQEAVSSKTAFNSAQLMDGEDDQQELAKNADDEKDIETVTKLMHQASNINKAKDIPEIPHADHEVVKKFFDPTLSTLKTDDAEQFAKASQISLKPENSGFLPVKTFGQLGLTSKMLETLADLKFEEPTPIQKIALPVLMAGHDVVAVAKTGSGKTLAFVLPMIRHIVANAPPIRKKTQTPIGLILTPTRELALQIHNDCKPFLKALNLRGVCCYGGSNISLQIADLKKGTELIVCTPGRLIDLLTANNGRVTNLSQVSSLVLDEADRMFDLGFEPQIMKIIKNIRPDRQTCLFSATFAKKIEMLATKVLAEPIQIIVGGGRSIVSDTITQRVMVVKPEDKIFRLLKILGDFINDDRKGEKLLIFCSTQDRCDNLLAQLLQRGYKGLSIHGGKDQVDRDGAINDFQRGAVPILVATSVAARGLDVKDLSIVVNYDAPNHMEDYVHRVGRTGRAGRSGVAYTFVEPSEERAAHDIAKALKMSKNIVPEEIEKLSTGFMEKLKEGTEKYSSGFGGKGLEKLEEARVKTKNLERKNHGQETDDANVSSTAQAPRAAEANENPERTDAEATAEIASIDFTIVDGPAPGKSDSRAFHCKIYINDLPQQARVSLSAEYPVVVEQTNVSITTKGTFVPNGASSKDDKLHILVESDDRMDVVNAVAMLKNSLIAGLKGSNEQELRKLRTGATGRYKV